jgi:hypothetical protein
MNPSVRASQVVLVNQRGEAVQFPQLGMGCDIREIPEPLDGSKPVGWWLAGKCRFEGMVNLATDLDGTSATGRSVKSSTSAAVVVTSGSVLGIIKPDSRRDPAIWFATPISDIRVETSGTLGTFKKRPAIIQLKSGEWGVTLVEIGRYYRHANRMQTSQEASFVSALRGQGQ